MVQGGPYDFTEEPVGSVGPTNATRLSRQGGSLVYSVNGAAPSAAGFLSTANAAKLATVAAGASIIQTFPTAIIDLTSAPGTTTTILAAQGAGIYLHFWLQRLSIVTRGGSITTAPIWKAGTNANHDNVGTGATVSTTNINNASAIIPATASAGFTLVASGTVEMSSDLVAEITQAAAGSTLTGRIMIMGHLTVGL